MSAWNWVRSNKALVVVVAILVAAAGILGSWIYVSGRGAGSPAATFRADGPTFYQALAAVNGSVAGQSGGPWALFSVFGIATQAPWSPGVVGYPSQNQTTNACSQQFNGLTLWNGTIPEFNGTFNSGTAPFWQFAFYSNTSQEILLATTVLGVVTVYPPFPAISPCQPWYDFYTAPTYWAQLMSHPLVDSPKAAGAAWTDLNRAYPPIGESAVEIMTIGPGVFDDYGDAGLEYGIIFQRCGIVDVGGFQPWQLAGVGSTGEVAYVGNGTGNCALQASGYGASDGVYDVVFSPPTKSTSGPTLQVTAPFQVPEAYPNGTLTNDYDAWGLANWMLDLNLTNSSGQALPLGVPGCMTWVPQMSACNASSVGRYAVLLSASGEWIDAYGSTPTGPAWTVPVASVVSHQQLVIVAPSSWNTVGDSLSVNSTVLNSKVVGSIVL
jgi:hypothetical protein